MGDDRAERAEYMRAWSEQNRDKVRSWVKRRRDHNVAAIAAIKLQRGCADCGFDSHFAALDFDHVRDVKLFSIGSGVHKKWEIILAEIEKCDVVCANCHRIRTFNRKNPDGTVRRGAARL